jgi:hypothetical protein
VYLTKETDSLSFWALLSHYSQEVRKACLEYEMRRLIILLALLFEVAFFTIVLLICISFELSIGYTLLLVPAGCVLVTINESKRLAEFRYTMLPLSSALKGAKELALRSLRKEESEIGQNSISDAESALQFLETVSSKSSLFWINPLREP